MDEQLLQELVPDVVGHHPVGLQRLQRGLLPGQRHMQGVTPAPTVVDLNPASVLADMDRIGTILGLPQAGGCLSRRHALRGCMEAAV